MLNGKGLKPGALLFSHLDGTVLWYHNTDLVIQLGKIAVTLYLLWDCIKIEHWHSGFRCQVPVVKTREPA